MDISPSTHGLSVGDNLTIQSGTSPFDLFANQKVRVTGAPTANQFTFNLEVANVSVGQSKTLTVNKGQANSHSNLGWGKFTLDVINKLIVSKIASKKPIVFILWGKESQKLAPTQESDYIKVIKAPHPAAEVYAGGKAGFFGSKPFTQCNEFLEKFSTQEIVW